MSRYSDTTVLIRGAGDLASGVAARLHRSGFPVVMTELPQPLMVRRAVSFGSAVYDGNTVVDGIAARHVADVAAVRALLLAPQVQANPAGGPIPVLVDPEAFCRLALQPVVLVDGIMAKRNTGTKISDALLVIALGPGFSAGVDCHAVVETNRGHYLGRVIWKGSAQRDTTIPGRVGERQADRVLRAPADGKVVVRARIGDRLAEGDIIATVGASVVCAPFAGVLRGLIQDGVSVPAGLKIGDVDPRADPAHCFTISDKSLAVAGGVLEAILMVL